MENFKKHWQKIVIGLLLFAMIATPAYSTYITPEGMGTRVFKAITLNANNTTVGVKAWKITGVIRVMDLGCDVTTTFGTNHTAAGFAQLDTAGDIYENITAQTFTGNSLAAGHAIRRTGLVAAAPTDVDPADGAVTDPSAVGNLPTTPFDIYEVEGADSFIGWHYSTTNTPTVGAMTCWAVFVPLSSGSNLVAV